MQIESNIRNQAAWPLKPAPLHLGGVARSAGVALPITIEQFSELTGRIYQGPLEAVPWTSALGLLRKHLQANWALLILRPASKDWPAIMIRAGEQGVELYNA